MKTKMKSILHFLIPALEVRELRREVERLQGFKDYVHQRLDAAGVTKRPAGEHSATGCRVGDRLDLLIAARDNAPVFVEKAVRDDQFGTEIAEAVKKEAVAKLAPALSREYTRILNDIAWTLPPPQRGLSNPPGVAMSAFDAKAETYRVRIELPAVSYDMHIAGLR